MDIEYESQELSQSDQEEEFVYHKPKSISNQKEKEKFDNLDTLEIEEECRRIKDEVLFNKLQWTAKQIARSIRSVDQDEQLIVPLIFKRSQEDDLELFIDILTEKLKNQEEEAKQKYFLQNIRYYHVRILKVDEVKKLALKIYITDEKIRLQKDIVLLMPNQICDLSPKNIYVFEEGLQNCLFRVIIPTFNDFLSYQYPPENKLTIIPHTLYNPKEVFCEFMHNCIISQKIKAYLPKEAIKLISDFDQYPISYQEGCRRLTYCIVKRHLLLKEHKLMNKIQYINIGELFGEIRHSFTKIFSSFKDFKNEKFMEKNIKCMLDEQNLYGIFSQYLNKLHIFQTEVETENKDEIEVINNVRKNLIKYLGRNESFQKYTTILEGVEPELVKKKIKRNRREDLFKIDPSLYKSQKDIFEEQISKIIKLHTDKIRKQATYVNWEQINFENRIRPELQLHIYKEVVQNTKRKIILNEITSHSSVSLSKLVHWFVENENYGEIMYLMKDLQLYGMIDIVRSAINPTVTPYFFPKSSFTRV